MVESIIQRKSIAFALSAIELYKQLIGQHEFVLSKQFLRSATSIGANVTEALAGISKRDFTSKMSIASKEARETQYWLMLLSSSQLAQLNYTPYIEAINEIIRILTAIVKTSQGPRSHSPNN